MNDYWILSLDWRGKTKDTRLAHTEVEAIDVADYMVRYYDTVIVRDSEDNVVYETFAGTP